MHCYKLDFCKTAIQQRLTDRAGGIEKNKKLISRILLSELFKKKKKKKKGKINIYTQRIKSSVL